MGKIKWLILIVALIAVIANLMLTDFSNFWEVNSLFRFSIPLITIIIILLIIRKDQKNHRNTN